jgi:hypothetical protein
MVSALPLCRLLIALGVVALAGTMSACGGKVEDFKFDGPNPDGKCSPEGAQLAQEDGCNTCVCSDGAWTCTELDCEPAACEQGDTKPADDGCNTCSCDDQGQWLCTEIGCVEPICSEGDFRDAGDGCNTCTCQNGSWGCTDGLCIEPYPVCKEGEYKYGPDSCSFCFCTSGAWSCTTVLDCGGQYECTPGSYYDDGCNSCSCDNGYFSCTDRYCPYTCVNGDVADLGDGCNSCTCAAGQWNCTDIACEVKGCGGYLGDTCADDEYCAYVEGQSCGGADASASCAPRPQGCDGIYAPVCGCDGSNYSSSCEAAMKGVGVMSAGTCEIR